MPGAKGAASGQHAGAALVTGGRRSQQPLRWDPQPAVPSTATVVIPQNKRRDEITWVLLVDREAAAKPRGSRHHLALTN